MKKQELMNEIEIMGSETSENYPHNQVVDREDVLNLIDQLDEPEVLSQEWIDEHAKAVAYDGMPDQTEIVYVDELKNLLIPKQELPVIPQFVAGWWEGDSVTMYGGEIINKKYKLRLISNFHDRGLGDYLSKVEDWLDENDSTFLDLINGKPYEVEKEQLYYVLDKQGKTLLMLMGGEVCTSGGYALSESTFTKDIYQLTEKQIKDYDERFWPFAVEVEE